MGKRSLDTVLQNSDLEALETIYKYAIESHATELEGNMNGLIFAYDSSSFSFYLHSFIFFLAVILIIITAL